MARFSNQLDTVRIATPCEGNWDEMVGDHRVRHCELCNRNVFNVSGMSRKAAEAMLMNTECRVCVRFYRRSDGTIITADCPVGIRAFRRKIARTAGASLSAVLTFFAGLGLYTGIQPDTQIQQIDPVKYSPIEINFPEKTIEQITSGRAVMGRPEVEHFRIPTQEVSSRDFQRR
jgi:hypothetical protein